MARIRLGDKFERFKTLSRGSEQKVENEKIRDTLMDLTNYAIMTIMELDELEGRSGEFEKATDYFSNDRPLNNVPDCRRCIHYIAELKSCNRYEGMDGRPMRIYESEYHDTCGSFKEKVDTKPSKGHDCLECGHYINNDCPLLTNVYVGENGYCSKFVKRKDK